MSNSSSLRSSRANSRASSVDVIVRDEAAQLEMVRKRLEEEAVDDVAPIEEEGNHVTFTELLRFWDAENIFMFNDVRTEIILENLHCNVVNDPKFLRSDLKICLFVFQMKMLPPPRMKLKKTRCRFLRSRLVPTAASSSTKQRRSSKRPQLNELKKIL
jgi:hypothetical protein